ncbi:MAG: hypothetical protein IH600_13070 [Bacteroidetes bacterium]|nr:hypothetical protein [Bacteroidota bacterium]
MINAKKFTELIEHIDLEVVRNFDSRKTAHLSEPLFESFNIGMNPEEQTAPIEALSIFYDDKNLGSIVERLDQEKQHHERMSLHDLVMLISEADFTLGVDISTIVNEQLRQGGAMKPERTATAGEDFEVPAIAVNAEDEILHGDLGNEHDALDFIISDEEEGVIVQDGDHIMRTLEDDVEEDMQRRDELRLMTAEDDVEDEFGASGDDEDTVLFAQPMEEISEEGEDQESDDSAFSLTDESILNLEAEFGTHTDYSADEESEKPAISSSEEDLPDIILGDDEDEPTLNYLSSKDVIPDITLEELGSISFGDGLDNSSAFEENEEEDPYMTSTVLDELAGADVVLDTSTGGKAAPSIDEIDWDKEAEEMDDINLDDVEQDEGKISDSLPGGEEEIKPAESLKAAEELLGELDLDDFDPTPVSKPSRHSDIPIIEDETPLPQSQRVPAQETEEDGGENGVATEEVIKEFGDLSQLLPVAEKKKYVRRLFNKNEDAFNRAIQVLNGKATWRQASEYIDELFIKFDVDMYSRLAVKFTDDIYKRYANKK